VQIVGLVAPDGSLSGKYIDANVADWSYAPTRYDNFACGVPGDGPGQLLFNDFAGHSR
jgi:hypothetical protein